MSLGQVALGVASIVMGVQHLRNGAKHLSGARRQQSLQGLGNLPGQQIMDSGRRNVVLGNGNGNASMRMRSFRIRSIEDRIRYLKKLADEGKRDPEVYAFARRALSRRCGNDWCIREKDTLSEAKAVFGELRRHMAPVPAINDLATAQRLFQNTRRNVRYTSDIAGVDTYQKPAHTLALKTADCDDFSSLTCSALGSIGIPCRYKVIRTKGARDWNHIYAQAGFPRSNPRKWVSMDASVNMPFGWEAPPRMVADSRVFRVG